MEKSSKGIQSIQRAVRILNCWDENNYELTLNRISELVNLNINTTRGLINTLVANDLVKHNPNNTYSLGLFYLHKAALLNKNHIGRAKEAAADFLEMLAEKYEVSSRLLVASSRSITTVKTVTPKQSHYLLMSNQEKPFPLHATASGKLLLAHIPKALDIVDFERFTENTICSMPVLRKQLEGVQKNGFSLEVDEVSLGISSVAVPIFDGQKHLFGTISITVLSPFFNDIKNEALPEMLEFAKILADKIFVLSE